MGKLHSSAAALLALAMLSCAAAPRAAAPDLPPLRVGTSGDYAPFSTVDARGVRRGLDIDIIERLASDLDLAIELVPFTWPELGDRLASGQLNMAISGITMRADRALRALSTRPYATTGVVVLVRGAGANELAALDLPGRHIGVNAGGHLERWTRAHFRAAAVVAVGDNRTLPDRLAAGAVDAIVSDTAEAPGWQRPEWRMLGPFSADYKAVFLPVDAVALADRVDTWLAAREDDGWLAAQRRRWLGARQAVSASAATRHAVVSWIALRLAMMPAVAAAKQAAALPIEDAAQEERVLERVAASAAHTPGAVALYRQLIAVAKVIQGRDAGTAPLVALPDLRAAIARIDRQLLRELARTPPTAAATWRALLRPALAALPLSAAEIERLARALAATSSADGDQRESGGRNDPPVVLE